MSDITETTRIVKVTDFVQECPPAFLTSETVPGPGGRPRLFTQKIQVLDVDLWRRLTTEIEKGDSIRVTVKTVWPDSGPYHTHLDSFSPLEVSSAVATLATAAI